MLMHTFTPCLKMVVSANWAFSRNAALLSGSEAAIPMAWSDVGNIMRV